MYYEKDLLISKEFMIELCEIEDRLYQFVDKHRLEGTSLDF